MKEKQITIKLSDLMERFMNFNIDPRNLLMARLEPSMFAVAMLNELFPEYVEDIKAYVSKKAKEEDAQNRAN